jgi:hypothetical protein
MIAPYIIFYIFIAVILFIVFTHLRPLKETEIAQLARKRRNIQIKYYFIFDERQWSANPIFKKNMNPNGKFYFIQESLFSFPSIAAALLKSKKHEWIIFAFEKNKIVEKVWVNKGVSNELAFSYLSAEDIAYYSNLDGYNSVLQFHNHPNSNPNYYTCKNPSEIDINSAYSYSAVLNQKGINLIEFVCERGFHYEYFRSISDKYLPLYEFIGNIRKINNTSKLNNLKLHFERIF